MDYKLKNDLTLGGGNAINENLKLINQDALIKIDALAENGEITREHVEKVVKQLKSLE